MNEREWRLRYGVSGDAMLPLVSIIVINWNYVDYLQAALDSAIAQDYPAIEIIALDNASTDGSAELMEAFVAQHPAVRLVRLPENLGQLGAAHHIFGHHDVAGAFVCFLDTDDLLFPHFVSHHVRAHLLVSQNAGISTSDAFQLDSQGSVIAGSLPHWRKDLIEPPAHWQQIEVEVEGSLPGKISATSISSKESRWFWYPGTANLFRSTILHDFFALLNAPIPQKYCIDASAAPFSHKRLGTLLLEAPLSAYRSHGRNTSSATPRLQHFRAHRQTFIASDKEQAIWFKLQRSASGLTANQT
ncbi:glycosyltransferase family 2 protein [Kaistia adipata]|uniref:glycosyltransferase family 2 protein n=1 Tax=Kaistia adipata TaxID=166954 RepID=UPI00048F9FF1|nr:glycosyltransferase family 2 protein [Kaistia adipata]